jgi:hypothetical protein
LRVEFDGERVVSDAGVIPVATLAERLGIEALGGGQCGEQGDALIYAMVLGADSIDLTDVLRDGRTRGRLPAPAFGRF